MHNNGPIVLDTNAADKMMQQLASLPKSERKELAKKLGVYNDANRRNALAIHASKKRKMNRARNKIAARSRAKNR